MMAILELLLQDAFITFSDHLRFWKRQVLQLRIIAELSLLVPEVGWRSDYLTTTHNLLLFAIFHLEKFDYPVISG
jgi:hypothetical protein